MEDFTFRNATKFVVKTLVASHVAQFTETAITDHTRFDEDDHVTNIGSSLVGWYVADKLKPVTDAIVDKTADKVTAFREARSAKKTTE